MDIHEGMRYGVSRHTLLFLAGSLWILAGANILRIGIVAWLNDTQAGMLCKAMEATIVFLLFFLFVFRKLLNKHTLRIIRKKDKNCPFSFFDVKSWMVMIGMISFGISIRQLKLVPLSFISVFYTGLAVALILTGILFLRKGYKVKNE